MSIFALADLHLAHAVPSKDMSVFGKDWLDYMPRIEQNWKKNVSADDLVLLPGDISWAMRPEEAKIDLEWIDNLPGTKVLIRGNHDYWWTSLSQVKKVLPPSLHVIQNNAFQWNNVSIGGAKLFDSNEYQFSEIINYVENPLAKKPKETTSPQEVEKIFERELLRLESSLRDLDPKADLRIVMSHYPPIGADLAASRASTLMKKYKVDVCVFGHLHSVKKGNLVFGRSQDIDFYLTAADFLEFIPLKIR